MLPPFIIEQIRRREEEIAEEQPRLELPLPVGPTSPRSRERRHSEEEPADRGVVIIDLCS